MLALSDSRFVCLASWPMTWETLPIESELCWSWITDSEAEREAERASLEACVESLVRPEIS